MEEGPQITSAHPIPSRQSDPRQSENSFLPAIVVDTKLYVAVTTRERLITNNAEGEERAKIVHHPSFVAVHGSYIDPGIENIRFVIEKWTPRIVGASTFYLCRICYSREKASSLAKNAANPNIGIMEGPDLYHVVDATTNIMRVCIWRPDHIGDGSLEIQWNDKEGRLMYTRLFRPEIGTITNDCILRQLEIYEGSIRYDRPKEKEFREEMVFVV